jgi:hypothetical protein
VSRTSTTGTVAISSDGSRLNLARELHYKYYFIPDGGWNTHSIFVRSENVSYNIDDDKRIAFRITRSRPWTPTLLEVDDSECSNVARRLELSPVRNYSEVAGIRVVRYRKETAAESHEAGFASAFSCELMEESEEAFNDRGLPISGSHLIVTKYIPGEPDPRLLQIPPNYRIIDSRY